MNFKPIKTKKIYEEIIDQIKNLLAEGELKPGDKLVSERELAEKLAVGRSAVREAFRVLEAMGVIEIRPGEGTFIRRLNTKFLLDNLTQVLSTEQNTIRELMEMRKILEVEAAALASRRKNRHSLEQMKKSLDQMEQDIKSEDLGEKADLNFHYSIVEAAHNSILLKLMNTISDTMWRVLKTSRQHLFLTPGSPQRLLEEHRDIYEAIKNGNSTEARKAMLKHLENVEERLFK